MSISNVSNFVDILSINQSKRIAVDKVIAKIIWPRFFWPTLYIAPLKVLNISSQRRLLRVGTLKNSWLKRDLKRRCSRRNVTEGCSTQNDGEWGWAEAALTKTNNTRSHERGTTMSPWWSAARLQSCASYDSVNWHKDIIKVSWSLTTNTVVKRHQGDFEQKALRHRQPIILNY